jgi:hypothetical protein
MSLFGHGKEQEEAQRLHRRAGEPLLGPLVDFAPRCT